MLIYKRQAYVYQPNALKNRGVHKTHTPRGMSVAVTTHLIQIVPHQGHHDHMNIPRTEHGNGINYKKVESVHNGALCTLITVQGVVAWSVREVNSNVVCSLAITESVDSICRDSADTQYMLIQKIP